ncbi:retrotransposon protein (fragment) [Schistosoma mansoni]|uniref:retrotransposon protein (fragment) n=1 Tax=Schistosoma mansoni TaxID=6183 RepID=UPI0001A61AD0
MAAPLNTLLGKYVNIKCTDKCQQSFDQLKEFLSSTPISTYSGYSHTNAHFILAINTSGWAMVSVLPQFYPDGRRKVMAYGSPMLRESKKNRCTTQEEMLIVA